MKKGIKSYNNRGYFIQEARLYAKFTQEQLAYALEGSGKISADLIKSMEQGKRNLTDRNSYLLADACGVDREYLVSFEKQIPYRDYEAQIKQEELKRRLIEDGPKFMADLDAGYRKFIWLVLLQFQDEYEITMMADNSFRIADGHISTIIDGEEIKKDLIEYAEFILKKRIETKLRDQAIIYMRSELGKKGITVLDEHSDGGKEHGIDKT